MSDQYRFATAGDSSETYSDGTILPHRMQAIERKKADGSWENDGYVELHLHRVKRDDTDIEDISVGITVRINPKR